MLCEHMKLSGGSAMYIQHLLTDGHSNKQFSNVPSPSKQKKITLEVNTFPSQTNHLAI